MMAKNKAKYFGCRSRVLAAPDAKEGIEDVESAIR